MQLSIRILAGARWATVLRMVAQIISWTCTIFVVRFISQEDYGLNAMLEAPAELLLLVSTFGLDTALVRARSVGQAELRSTFGWLLLVNGTLFVAYFFSSGLIADYFNEPRLEQLAKVLAFVFLFVPFRVIPNAMLDRELKFKSRADCRIGNEHCECHRNTDHGDPGCRNLGAHRGTHLQQSPAYDDSDGSAALVHDTVLALPRSEGTDCFWWNDDAGERGRNNRVYAGYLDRGPASGT